MATTTVHVRAASRGAARTSVQPDIRLALPRYEARRVRKEYLSRHKIMVPMILQGKAENKVGAKDVYKYRLNKVTKIKSKHFAVI